MEWVGSPPRAVLFGKVSGAEALSPSDTQPCTRTATYLALRQAVHPSLPYGAVVAVVQKFLPPPSAAMEDIDTLAFYTQDHFCAATADGDHAPLGIRPIPLSQTVIPGA